MDPATACTCSTVDVKCVTRKKKRLLDFVKLQKVLGPSNLNWFDDLSAKTAQKRQHDPDMTTPKQLLVNPESPCFQRQQVELLQAATPGMCSLTPLSAWALLSSQDPNTSTPSSLDRPINGSRPDVLSPPLVDSCLKTCKGISERLGLPTDDTNLSWTNSMATPCLGGDAPLSQESVEVCTPAPKPKENAYKSPKEDVYSIDLKPLQGFPRALFSPEVGRGDSDELVKALSVTLDEDILSCGSPQSQIPQVKPDLRKNMMKELFFKSSGQAAEVLVLQDQQDMEKEGQHFGSKSSSPVSAPNPGKKHPVVRETSSSPSTPQSGDRRLIKRRNVKTAMVRSPLVSDRKQAQTKEIGRVYERVVDIDEDVQLKINILRTAASFEGDVSVLPGSSLKEKLYCSDTNMVNQSFGRTQNIKADDEAHSDSAVQQKKTSPLLNRKVGKAESQCQIRKKKGHPICTSEVNKCETRTVVSQVLSDFMDSPSSVQSMRRSPPNKGQKRKSLDNSPKEDYKDGVLLSTPSPMGSQTTALHSILSSSKKRKVASSRKRVRFAEKLCQREGEALNVAKKLDYVKCSVTATENSSAISDPCNETDSSSPKESKHINKDGQTSPDVEVKPSSVLNETNTSFNNSEGKLNSDCTIDTVPDGEQILFEPEQCALEVKSGVVCDSEYNQDCVKCSSEKVTLLTEDVSVGNTMELQAPPTGAGLSENKQMSKQPVPTIELSTGPEEVAPNGDNISGNMPDSAKSKNDISYSDASSSVHSKSADEMFTQVSPSSLTKMCLVADSDAALEKTEIDCHLIAQTQPPIIKCEIKSSEKHSMTRFQKEVVDVCGDDKDFAQTKDLLAYAKDEKELETLGDTKQCVQYNKNDSSDVSSGCDPCVSLETIPQSLCDILDTDVAFKRETSSNQICSKILRNASDVTLKQTTKVSIINLFPKKSKPKKFFYPSSSQIKSVCPETVYNFKDAECDSKTTVSVGDSRDSASTQIDQTARESVENSDLKTTGSVRDQLDDQKTKTTATVTNLADDVDPKVGGTFCASEGPAVLTSEIVKENADIAAKKANTQYFTMGLMKFSEMFDDNMDDEFIVTSSSTVKKEENPEGKTVVQNPPEANNNSIATAKPCIKVDLTETLGVESTAHESGTSGSSVPTADDRIALGKCEVDSSLPHGINSTAKESGAVDKSMTLGVKRIAQEGVEVDSNVVLGNDNTAQDKREGESRVHSVWVPSSQDVHNMMQDVEEELFSDIEFSQMEPINQFIKDACRNKETTETKDGEEITLEKAVEISSASTEIALSKQNDYTEAIGDCKSVSSDLDNHVFKMPDIPERSIVQKSSVLSDSDLDSLLSDVDLAGPVPRDSDKPDLNKKSFQLEDEKSDVFSSDGADFETCVSEQESTRVSQNVKGSKCAVSSSVSDSDTDEYVTSTEEVKEVSPEGKKIMPRSKITTRSRSSRKNSVLLCRSQMMSDSDSDINPAGIWASKKRKACPSKHHSDPIQYESPAVVSESNPLVLWSDLEGHDTCQLISSETHVSDDEKPLKTKLENDKHESDDTVKMEEPLEMATEASKKDLDTSECIAGTETKLPDGQTVIEKTSRPCNVSDWSDLESGEADEAEQEVIRSVDNKIDMADEQELQQQIVEEEEKVTICVDVGKSKVELGYGKQDNYGERCINGNIETVNSNGFSLGNTDIPQKSNSDLLVTKKVIKDGFEKEQSEECSSLKTSHSKEMMLSDNETSGRSSQAFTGFSTKGSLQAFIGFSTAGGTKIEPDRKSLQKASTLFETFDKFEDSSTVEKGIFGQAFMDFSAASEKHVDSDAKSLQKSAVLFDEKIIAPLDKSDLKASFIPSKRKKTYIDITQVAASCLDGSDISGFPSFSTASGKTLTLPEDALRKAEAMLSVEDPEVVTNHIQPLKKASDCVQAKTSEDFTIVDDIPSSAGGAELESILGDLLKSKKSLKEQSQSEKSELNCKSTRSQKQVNTINNDNIEEMFNAKFARSSAGFKSTSVVGFSAAGKTQMKPASCKGRMKDPMLKPKGFRPFKKPRIVQKPNSGEPIMKDKVDVHAPSTSSAVCTGQGLGIVVGTPDHLKSYSDRRKASCFAHGLGVCVSKPSKTGVNEQRMFDGKHLPVSVKSVSDMSEMLLLEFSRDMTELSQTGQAAVLSCDDKSSTIGNHIQNEVNPVPKTDAAGVENSKPFEGSNEEAIRKEKTFTTSNCNEENTSAENAPISNPALQTAKPSVMKQKSISSSLTGSSSTAGSDAHLMLMDVLFEGDMSSQLDVRSNSATEMDLRVDKSRTDGQLKAKEILNSDSGCADAIFQTASGKGISVSENSLDYSEELWSDVAKDGIVSTSYTNMTEKQTDHVVPHGYNISEEKEQQPVTIGKDSKTHKILKKPSSSGFMSSLPVGEQNNVLVGIENGLGKSVDGISNNTSCVFQTASGKAVSVMTESLSEAQKIWDDSHQNVSVSENALNETGKIAPILEELSTSCEYYGDGSVQVPGLFQTASGRNVSVTETSLAIARKTLDDDTGGKHFDLFQTDSFKRVETSDTAMNNAREMWSKTLVGEDGVQLQPSSLFQTASGKGFNVSEMAVAKAKKMLMDNNEQELTNASSSSFQTVSDVQNKSEMLFEDNCSSHEQSLVVQEVSGMVDRLPESCLPQTERVFKDEASTSSFFKTASEPSVTVSSKALREVRKCLINDQPAESASMSRKSSGFPISLMGQKVLETCRNPNQKEQWSKTSTSSLFQTASGTTVTVSTKALAKGKKLWNDDLEQNSTCSTSSLFKTASGASVNVSAEAIAQGKKLWADETNKKVESSVSSLFQTASGASVSVSAKALTQGKKLWADETNQTAESSVSSLFETASGASLSVSAKAFSQGKTLWTDETNKKVETSVSLFQTASGASVSESAESFTRGKKLWADATNQKVEKTSASSLFQTVSGASVSVSAEAIARGKKLWTDESDHEAKSSSLNLFQRASGGSIDVSAKALAQGKQLWTDGSDKVVESSVASVFKTASGGSADVSAKALAQGKKLWADESSETTTSSTSSLFQTASGTSVCLSVEAIARGKKLWTDESDQRTKSSSLSLFQTASGTSVNVSSTSLEKGRLLMNDASSESGKNTSVSESSHVNQEQLLNVEKDVAVVPQDRAADGAEKTRDEQGSRTPDMTSRMDHNSSSRTPLISTPEAVFLDHCGRDGRRFAPVRSTSLTSTRRSEEYTIEAVTSKSVLNTSRGISSNFKTPYKNSAFVTPVRRGDTQQRPARREGKTPVFHPKASLRTNRNLGRDSLSNQNLSGAVLSSQNSNQCKSSNQNEYRQGLTDHSLSSNQLWGKTVSTSDNTGRCSPSSINHADISEGVPADDTLITLYPPVVESSNDITTLHDSNTFKTKKNMMATDQSTDLGVESKKEEILKTENDSVTNVFTNIKSCLEDARKKQDEIIQCKKKQKIRPCCGRVLSEKSSAQHKLQYRDLVMERCHSVEQLWSSGVKRETYNKRSCNAEEFRFHLVHFYPQLGSSILVGDGAELIPDNSGFAGKEEFYRSFLTLEGVDPKLTSDLWVYNHYRWIVWKMAAYEVTLPVQFGGICLTPNNVMLQLKYRYDREVDRCHRSALKKIVERDDAACKRMVLCVAGIRNCPSGCGENSATSGKFLELTDGWYSLTAQLDIGLTELVERKKICVGDKICVSGAELTGSQDACTPLEIPDNLHLKISLNSTRPAPWDSKLGYQRDPRPLCLPISSLHAEGGVVGCLDAVVTRIYPLMYMEKLTGGGSVFRSEEAEERVQRLFDRHKQDKMEKLYTELQSGLEQDDGKGRRKSRKRWTQQEVEELQTGQEIYEAVEGSLQPEELHSWLSTYQQHQMEEHQRRLQEQRQQQLQDKLHKAWEDAQQGETSRNVTPVLKLRLSGCAKRDIDAKTSPIVTVWRPTAEWLGLQEGKRYKMFGLTATTARTRLESHSVHLTATRQTRLQHLSVDENYLDLVYEPREVWQVRDLRSRSPAHKEFDFGGIVVSHHTDTQRNCDTVVVADADGDTLNIRFWGRMQSFGVEDQLSQGKCFVATNLILKGTYGMIMADACHEVSRFSSSTKLPAHRKCLARFTNMTKAEKQKLIEAVQSKLNNSQTRNSAPAQHMSATPEKFFSDLPSECLQRLFSPMEETAVTKVDNSDTPDASVRKRRAALRERSSKLLAYGSPKPLSPLTVKISPAVSKAFKSPFNLAKM